MNKYFMTALAALSLFCINKAKAQKPVVLLDNYFNNEYRKTPAGNLERFHYTWEDTANTGYSILGSVFRSEGFTLKTLSTAPTAQRLSGSRVYIIVDPDTKKETAAPHFIQAPDVKAIAGWVKQGGILLLFANDSTNVELPHFNGLAAAFGIHFNDDLQNHVIGEQFDMGGLIVQAGDPIFKTARNMYIKDVCSLTLKAPARPAFVKDGKILMATSKFGKGMVFVVGDPWFYNEYTNGRLPKDFDNDKGARDLARWALSQINQKK